MAIIQWVLFHYQLWRIPPREKKEPSKLGLDPNVWFRVASCLFSGLLFTITIKIAGHLRGSCCWKIKSTIFLKPYTKCNKQLHSLQLVLFSYDLIKSYFRIPINKSLSSSACYVMHEIVSSSGGGGGGREGGNLNYWTIVFPTVIELT